MTLSNATIQQIIDRASEDPDFVVGLAQDPQGALETAGIAVSAEDAQSVGAAIQARGESLAEPLGARISPAGLASLFGILAHEVGTFAGHYAAPAVVHDGQHAAPATVHMGRELSPNTVHMGEPTTPATVHMGQRPSPDAVHMGQPLAPDSVHE